ncbi:MAG TPA: glycerophosphodiester phosphodiesterase [Gaiellales bacterium]|nr:glycerophosphodiester phosphodiesterase [Gaiellales bacterium]
MLRIGHRGAAALAPENTIAAVRAALAAGVDGIEFDVCPGLVVAHDRGRPGPALADFLADVRALAPDDLALIVDIKSPGYEQELLATCRAAGVAERCIFSTMEFTALAVLNPLARTSVTLSAGRAWLPAARRTPAVAMYHRSGARDATVRHDCVTPELVDAVHAREGRVYAWTVNTRRGIERMRELGVDGVISDDPTLFQAAPDPPHDPAHVQ